MTKTVAFAAWLAGIVIWYAIRYPFERRSKKSKVALSLARAMRLTQQAQMHPRTAGRAMPESGPKLWDRKPWDDC